jgi:hypothetical protein
MARDPFLESTGRILVHDTPHRQCVVADNATGERSNVRLRDAGALALQGVDF